ncbi:MAG TPA: hypothetical protein VGO47_13415 [Chlamydiales bacterium]|nr:hypothetical protein [Chlamydiales bacterium]
MTDYRLDFYSAAKRKFNEGISQGIVYSYENGMLDDPIPWYW